MTAMSVTEALMMMLLAFPTSYMTVVWRQMRVSAETRQQSSFEMIIPVLELLTLHFGKGHVSELNILE